MSNTSLDISGKIDTETVAIYRALADISQRLNVPFLVIGATARDTVLHYGHGTPIQRATTDVDFAVQVATWQEFEQVKQQLVDAGFKKTDKLYRLASPNNTQTDIVPFGGLQENAQEIAFPPKGDFVMNVLGFDEALAHAEWVRVDDNPELVIQVATPEGITLMKLVAWTDREYEKRSKDALDLGYLLSTYENIPSVNDAIWADHDLMERYEWEPVVASAYWLGKQCRTLSSDATAALVLNLLTDQLGDGRRFDQLYGSAEQGVMIAAVEVDLIFEAFKAGYSEG